MVSCPTESQIDRAAPASAQPGATQRNLAQPSATKPSVLQNEPTAAPRPETNPIKPTSKPVCRFKNPQIRIAGASPITKRSQWRIQARAPLVVLFILAAMILHLAAGLPGGFCLAADAPTTPPNIIIFLADDLGWRDLGYAGSTFYESPNIDALAARGTVFTNAYAACPVCSPTRAAFLTGKYPQRVRITD